MKKKIFLILIIVLFFNPVKFLGQSIVSDTSSLWIDYYLEYINIVENASVINVKLEQNIERKYLVSLSRKSNLYLIHAFYKTNNNLLLSGKFTLSNNPIDTIAIQIMNPLPPYEPYDSVIVRRKIMKKGEWNYYYENSNVKEIQNYKQNVPSGKWRRFFENGKLNCLAEAIKNGSFKLITYINENDFATVKDGNGFIIGDIPFLKINVEKAIVKNGFLEGEIKILYNGWGYGIATFKNNKIIEEEDTPDDFK